MNQDHEILEETNAVLNESIESVSPAVQSRLDEARSAAIAKLDKSRTFHFDISSFFNPRILSAAVACSFLAFLIFPLIDAQNADQSASNLLSSNSDLGEFILLNSFDETELDVIEDIEFAYWLSQELDQDNGLHNG